MFACEVCDRDEEETPYIPSRFSIIAVKHARKCWNDDIIYLAYKIGFLAGVSRLFLSLAFGHYLVRNVPSQEDRGKRAQNSARGQVPNCIFFFFFVVVKSIHESNGQNIDDRLSFPSHRSTLLKK